MDELESYEGVAFNSATASENRIHSDEVARQYGFRGGLVPGVTVHAYLVEPAIRAWGLDWLERGRARVRLLKPLYEGAHFRVEVDAPGSADARVTTRVIDDEGVVCAEGEISAPAETLSELPVRRGDAPVPALSERPEASLATLEALRKEGMGALTLVWDAREPGGRYKAELDAMPDCVRADRGGWAHPGFTLGLANWVLSANVKLGPWIHVQSDVTHYAACALGTEVHVEARVTDLFERRGHEMVDLQVEAYGEADAPLLSATHRAIYRPRVVR